MINGMKTRIRKGHGADCRFDGLGKSYFRIIWDQWRVEFFPEFRDHYICCDPDTGEIRAEKECIFRRKDIK